MSRVCPECGREYFGQTVKCIHCNIPLVEKSISQTVQQARGKTAQQTRQTAAQINYQRAKQTGEEQEKIRQQQQLLLLEQEQKKENKKKQVNSTLGILALVFSVLGCTFWLGIILAIVDLCKKDGKKKTCSVVALCICGFLIFIGAFASIMDSDSPSKKVIDSSVKYNTSQKEVSEEELESEQEKIVAKEKNKSSNRSFTYKDLEVNFVEAKIENDYSGEECLVLYFDYTNGSDENEAFIYSFTVRTFQNGVELDDSYFHVNDETKNTSKEIQPGTSVRVAVNFAIGEDRSPVDVEVTPWISFNDELLANFTINF